MKCKTCGQQFHWCHNCSTMHIWKKDFCSITCFRKSNEYAEIFQRFRHIKISADDLAYVYDNEEAIRDILGI